MLIRVPINYPTIADRATRALSEERGWRASIVIVLRVQVVVDI